ncbi:MAG TPA: UPF0175 family protein [Blastocatellia bacterium]|nr:UPF0175 family protein [Blastocatellia bacterium]HMV84273.1 UPF0175 family protein [Blastocatellia bacterium]HMX28822.1 UPF0175 family protein [Blastocatellia bacterium]HNG34130.1 UPF0175 family protein [Blastocatellia bacterium]
MMSTATGTQLCDVLALARQLSETDRERLRSLLNRPPGFSVPERVSVDEAIELYLAEVCGIGRAAKLAGVTRWDLLARMKERGITLYAVGDRTAVEMDALAAELRQEELL